MQTPLENLEMILAFPPGTPGKIPLLISLGLQFVGWCLITWMLLTTIKLGWDWYVVEPREEAARKRNTPEHRPSTAHQDLMDQRAWNKRCVEIEGYVARLIRENLGK